ncbi:MAG: ABC transporter permease subunit [Phycisphaerales bacterium]
MSPLESSNADRDQPSPAKVLISSRRTPLSARGEPAVWLVGLALCLCITLVVALMAVIVREGLRTFWPRPIELVTLVGGERLLGTPMQDEAFDASGDEGKAIEARRADGKVMEGAFEKGRPVRRLYRVGNRDVGQEPFRWVTLANIESIERPSDAAMLERQEWGVWIGVPRALVKQETIKVPASSGEIEKRGSIDTPDGPRPVVREVLSTESDGTRVMRQRVYVAGSDAGDAPTIDREFFDRQHREALDRAEKIASIEKGEIGAVNHEMESWRLRVRKAEIERDRSATDKGGMLRDSLALPVWGAAVLGVIALAGLSVMLGRRADHREPMMRVARPAVLVLACVLGLWCVLENPWSHRNVTDADVSRVKSEADEALAKLQSSYDEAIGHISEIRKLDEQYRVIVEDAGGRFAPVRQTTPDEPLMLSQIVRMVQPNSLGAGGKCAVYLSRWAEFLSGDPRDTNTAGGVFPVLFGTVSLTLLLSLLVVPMGVVAALYLREYARQGLATSIVRIAVNNLAGVPSIVYGVFGLGFFCYTLGQYIDQGPRAPAMRFDWWLTLGGAGAAAIAAISIAVLAKPTPGAPARRAHRVMAFAAGACWLAAAGLGVAAFFSTPYFHGFFAERAPNPVFGTRGLLWASITLALMTLPVVIVATEEAIASVPRSMREGSYGCGASKWQTIRRIVLPGAMPGIMTGMILAMARGAGEVAPLMLVGAVKLAPDLPISTSAPFVHLERSFMHLGFHIYDLGFQSPDSEAARPLVWTTTLLLIAVVATLNVAAIWLRASLRSRMKSGVF